jgi:Ulp1 family protease
MEKLNSVLDVSEWTFIDAVCPAQENARDCGVFLCAFSEYLLRDAQFNFTQDHMMSFRQLIAHELTLKRLVNVNDEDEKKLLIKLFDFI